MITINEPKLYERMKSIPKAEIHLHIDGSIPAKDIFRISKERSISLTRSDYDLNGYLINYPDEEAKEIKTPEELSQYWMDWNNYSIPDRFGLVTGLMQTREEIKAICKTHVHTLSEQNIFYAESRFAPQYHLQKGLTLEQVIGYALEGLKEGTQETGVIVKLIICIGREVPLDKSIEITKAALHFQNDGVVALDLACYEPPFPPELHKKAFELTFDSNLYRTVHAGEMCKTDEENLRNIYYAITKLKANGIGHGIPLYKRYYKGHDLIELMVENNIRLESNPVSNLVVTGLEKVEDLHLDKLMEQGILVTINSDDPAMWPNGSLAENLYIMAEKYKENFVHKAIKNTIRSSFGLTKEEKDHYADIKI